jgi:hypothetical protein
MELEISEHDMLANLTGCILQVCGISVPTGKVYVRSTTNIINYLTLLIIM